MGVLGGESRQGSSVLEATVNVYNFILPRSSLGVRCPELAPQQVGLTSL